MKTEAPSLERVLKTSAEIEQLRREITAKKATLAEKEALLLSLVGGTPSRIASSARRSSRGTSTTGLSAPITELLQSVGGKALSTEEIAARVGAQDRLQSLRSIVSRLVRNRVLEKAGPHLYRAASKRRSTK